MTLNNQGNLNFTFIISDYNYRCGQHPRRTLKLTAMPTTLWVDENVFKLPWPPNRDSTDPSPQSVDQAFLTH